jgi:hypothetical protein
VVANALDALEQSVQVRPKADEAPAVLRLGEARGVTLPPWGSRQRERVLRWWDRSDANWLWQGARAGLINKWLATPYTVTGPATGINHAAYYQNVLRDAEFGEGWDVLWSKVWRDFLRQDGGAYLEIIGPGSPLRPITGRVTGLAHLDSLRCYATGDPEFPVVYYNRMGSKHKLHFTRVLHLVDMPDGDEFRFGYGECALSRAIAIAEQQYYMLRYIRANLDELPPPGFAVLKNMTKDMFMAGVAEFQERKQRDLPMPYGNLVLLPGLKSDQMPEVDITTYSSAPEKFDYVLWVNCQVNAMAMVLGIDKQEIWELGGSGLGSGKQSEVLHLKSQGRMYGHMLSIASRNLNDVLPPSCEQQFEKTDSYESQEAADTAQKWAGFVESVAATLSVDEQRQLIANVVPQYKDVVVDAAGKLIRLPDDDVKPAEEDQDVSLDDDTEEDGTSTGGGATKPTNTAQARTRAKAFDQTAGAFSRELRDAIDGARENALTRRRAGTVMRALLNRHGKSSYGDGLADGGVADGLSDEDRLEFTKVLATQSGYVTDFLDNVYQNGISDEALAVHISMWVNKSLTAFYNAGLTSADANGLYEWQLGIAEHCATCIDMTGQRHRLRTYMRKGIYPNSDKLLCGGFLCKCSLKRVKGKERGKWTANVQVS